MPQLDTIAPPPCSSRNAGAERGADATAGAAAGSARACRTCRRRGPRWTRGAGTDVDVVFVTGDAYVDHPAFAMGILGRVLEAAGFRVAILSQPDWQSAEPWRQFGRPRLFFGISAGNMDSMINHYTANKKVRNDDAYSPGGRIGLRPDRATMPYCQRAREAFPGVPVIAGGVEASLRRLAHYDYWSDTVKRSILLDSKADLVVFGMGEQPIVEIARRLAAGRVRQGPARHARRRLRPGRQRDSRRPTRSSCRRIEEVKTDKQAFAQATRIIHQETNPLNARTLVQYHDRQAVVCNPPALPISQEDMDRIYGLPYTRRPHPMYRGEPIPAFEAVKDSVTIMRGLLRRLHVLLDHGAPGADHPVAVAGIGPDRTAADGAGPEVLGRRLRHRRPDGQHVPDALHAARGRGEVQAALVRPPEGLQAAGHRPRPAGRADAREPRGPGRRKVLRRLGHPDGPGPAVARVPGGTGRAPRRRPPEGRARAHRPRRAQADEEARARTTTRASPRRSRRPAREAGKKQYLVPYFIASHPGSDLDAMIDLALFLKRNGYRPDQVQDFIPAPFDIATCMYYTGLDPFTGEEVYVAQHLRDRKLQRALLQFFKPENYFVVREALLKAGRQDLIGSGCDCLIPAQPPKAGDRSAEAAGERGRRGRPLPFHRQPSEGRAGRRARLAESGLPTGAEDGASPGQEAEAQGWRPRAATVANVRTRTKDETGVHRGRSNPLRFPTWTVEAMSRKAQTTLEDLRLAIHGVTSLFSCEGTFVPNKPVTFVFKDQTRFEVVRAKSPFDQENQLKPLLEHCKPSSFWRWEKDPIRSGGARCASAQS